MRQLTNCCIIYKLFFMKKDQITPKFVRASASLQRNGCWLWRRYRQSGGYGQIRLSGERILAHRLSWLVHNGAIPDGLNVCHHCDTPACVNPKHLFLGTAKDNARDSIAKGRNLKGFCKGHKLSGGQRIRKLSDDDVRWIRASNWKQIHIADKFKIPASYVCSIRKGRAKALVSD
jgi:hypothetical protein